MMGITPFTNVLVVKTDKSSVIGTETHGVVFGRSVSRRTAQLSVNVL